MTTFDNERYADPIVAVSEEVRSADRVDVGGVNDWPPPELDRSLGQDQLGHERLVDRSINELRERIDDDYLEVVERLDDLTERIRRLESALGTETGYGYGDRLDELERAVDEFAGSGGPEVFSSATASDAAALWDQAGSTGPAERDDPMARLALSLAEPESSGGSPPTLDAELDLDPSRRVGVVPATHGREVTEASE